MNRTSLIMAVAAGAIATAPAMAQQSRDSTVPPNREETVPLQLKAGQIMEMQQRLNKRGFSAGHTDGIWGPDTSAAVMNFQKRNGLQATGKLDQPTLKALGVVGVVAASAAPATLTQNTTVRATKPPPGPAAGSAMDGTLGTSTTETNAVAVPAAPATLAQNATAPAANPPGTSPGSAVDKTLGTNATGTNPGANTPDGTPANPPGTAAGSAVDKSLGTNATGSNPNGSNAGTNAAAGDSNQAVATTNANAPQPAHGANSFSRGQAQTRIAGHGFQNVSDLHKDNNGVWRGTAMKDGQQVKVWLDYKGNAGQQ